MLRAEVLDTAKKAVCKDRQNAYGPPERNFEDIARMASVALGKPLTALDIAKILCCVKLARMKSSPYHSDNYVDLAGYAACAALRKLRRWIARAERRLSKQKLPPSSLGDLGQPLGVKATTPCILVPDVRARAIVRAALLPLLGSRPPKVDICHRCDRPECVNIEHLFFGTRRDNIRDCAMKGRRRRWAIELREKLVAWRILLRILEGE
jgi:hypothetical protein